ncbi:MAG: hypothetical protein ACYDA5_07085 [Vulcanimicrobiaceae bacterium]
MTAALVAAAPKIASVRRYTISGSDIFTVGRQPAERVTYRGTQRLRITQVDRTIRFEATARYVRNDGAGDIPGTARFVQLLLPGDNFADRSNHDPEDLTILNQPFSIQLDRATLAQLYALKGSAPFALASPMAGGTLHGTLTRGSVARLAGQRVLEVTFAATGRMHGPLPSHPSMDIDGRMQMHGTADYALWGGWLVAFSARLNIAGAIADLDHAVPVKIVYHRSMRQLAGAAP